MPKLPNLTIPRNEADALLTVQLEKINSIYLQMDELGKPKGLESAEQRFKKWDYDVGEILKEIFDSDDLVQEYLEIRKDLIKPQDNSINALGFYEDNIRAKTNWIKGLKSRLSLYKEVIKEPVSSDEDIWNLIHPSITGLCKTRFDTGHYADSVETAFKHINETIKNKIKKKTGKELDGASLMNTAFSPNNPILVLDDLSTESGKNIQQGYMMMFAGAMTGIRNPKAHGVVTIDEEEAIHLLFFASLLMHKYDQAI